MARVLISFLGTGKMKDGDNAKGEYEYANYQIDNKTPYKAAFIADALIKAYSIDKVVLIGTVKSMWDEVYANFAGDDLDSDIWENLQKIRQSVSHKSELALKGIDKETGVEIEVAKETIEKVLPGNDSKIVLIKYGLDETEIDDNISKILGIEEYLSDNDEIYFDITHGFRSLPMVLMNSIIYLQNVSNKKLTIKKITYGNLDVSSELKYAPVIDLSKLLNLSDWINGAYAFKEFGKGYLIAKLLGYNPKEGKDEGEKTEDKKIGEKIYKFSNVMGADFLSDAIKQVKEFANDYSTIEDAHYNQIAKILIPSIIKNYLNQFGISKEEKINDSKYQYEIAKWHLEHMNYSSAIIDILEALFTKVQEICETTNYEKAKIYLGKKNQGGYAISEIERTSKRKLIEDYIETTRNKVIEQEKSTDDETQIEQIEQELRSFLEEKYQELKEKKKDAEKDNNYTLKNYISDAIKIINPEKKNDFELMYSINIFRNAIAHQNELDFVKLNDIIKITKLCIELLGKLI